MIRAIIFDCFGVLTTDGWSPFKDKYFSKNSELTDQAIDLNKRANAGLMSHDDFIQQIAELAGLDRRQTRHEIDDNAPNTALFDFISADLKPQYKIGMLSNAGRDWLHELFSPEQIELFDAIALSYRTGLVKPDEQAYRDIASQLDVEPEACIFVDDQERYCAAAGETGMRPVVFSDTEQAIAEIQRLISA